jgi:hypothetical protein
VAAVEGPAQARNQKTGKLIVDNVKVHKVPVQEDGVWTQVPRYTFDGMDIEETN